MHQILIVEDDPALSQGIRLALGQEGRQFVQAGTIGQAERELAERTFDLLILDLNLPDGNGLDLLSRLRDRSALPVLILTANDLEMDQVTGLELGADDYVTKPFSLAVLLANAYGVQNNYEVAQTQSYGPAARGGACKAELVVSDERIDYVKADKLDSFVAFNKPSFDKFKGDINPDTRLFVDSTFVTAEDVSGTPAKQVFLFPATKYAEENFRVVCTNIVMMGYIVAHNPDISLENAQNAIRAVMNPKVVDLNLKALQFGYEHGKADLA